MAECSRRRGNNGSQRTVGSSETAGLSEDMPMNHYIHQIPLYRDDLTWGCGWQQLQATLDCQSRMLEKILVMLENLVDQEDT